MNFSLDERVEHLHHEIKMLLQNATALKTAIHLPTNKARTMHIGHLIKTSRMMILASDQLIDMIEELEQGSDDE